MGSVCGCDDSKAFSMKKTVTFSQPISLERDVCAGIMNQDKTLTSIPENSPVTSILENGPSNLMGRLVAHTEESGHDEFKGPRRVFKVKVAKKSSSDSLGIDVKHINGRLEVLEVLNGGAVHKANVASKQMVPEGEQVLSGDFIERVNNVTGSESIMIAACKNAEHTIVFQVCRESGHYFS